MLAGVVTAMMVLAPTTVGDAIHEYADSITHQASGIDPFLIVALIHVETGGRWDRTLVSKTNDYGLTQVHVSRTTNADYLGREHELLDPSVNIRVSVRMLTYWKKYHSKRCDKSHKWWAHYKWGVEIKSESYARKITRVYTRVKRINRLVQEGQFDHRYRGVRRKWEGHASSCCRSRVQPALRGHLFSTLQWSLWPNNSSPPKRRGDVDPKGLYWGVIALPERRRSIPGTNDNGQV